MPQNNGELYPETNEGKGLADAHTAEGDYWEERVDWWDGTDEVIWTNDTSAIVLKAVVLDLQDNPSFYTPEQQATIRLAVTEYLNQR